MITTSGSLDPSSYPTPATSVAQMFRSRVAASPGREAFRFPTEGGWESVTWAETDTAASVMAAGLLALGVRSQDRVAILSTTRIEWIYADLAIMCAGAGTTAIYPTTGADDVVYNLADSGSRIAFAENDEQIAKLRERRDELPDLIHVVTFDGTADGEWVLSLADLRARGEQHLSEHPQAVDESVHAIQPEHLATLMYTSGTTGRPKGVKLPHRCWTYIGAGAEAMDILYPEDLQYLWLPLSHSFAKMLLAVQLQIGFATAVDGRIDQIVENLMVVRPTVMAGPPRVFEKVYGTVAQGMQDEGGLKLRLFNWAFDVGARVSQARHDDRRPGFLTRAQHALADRLVLSRVRARLGGRIRLLVSGSAPLSSDVADWFNAAGLPLVEGYALTETGGGSCISRPQESKTGTVGPPLVGSELRIADDGEILLRGPNVMSGYHNLPEATAEVLDADGWFASGDIGEIDEAGRLRITDRKKDMIKTSGGKYIAPQNIEAMFKAVCPIASQMLVHADGRKYATALIALDPDALKKWARSQGLTDTDYTGLVADTTVREYVLARVDELNGRLNHWETIKDFRILGQDLSLEAGDLTPSLKVKRKVVETKFAPLLDDMYQEGARAK